MRILCENTIPHPRFNLCFLFPVWSFSLLSEIAAKCSPLISNLAQRAEDAEKDTETQFSFTKY